MKVRLKEDGFGILETLIALGLLGAIALGVMQMMEQGYKASSDLNSRQELRYLKDEFHLALIADGCGVDLDSLPPLDLSKSDQVKFTELEGVSGQTFVGGMQYGKISIHKDNPFYFAPPSRKSPILEGLDPSLQKTSGGYWKLDTGEYVAELVINIVKPKSAGGREIPMRFLAFLTLNPGTTKIGTCKSVTGISSAKEGCSSMSGLNMNFEWNDTTAKCDVTLTLPPSAGGASTGGASAGAASPGAAPTSGIYISTDKGDVEAIYVL